MPRKSKLHPTMVRLPEDLRLELEKLANFYGRSLNNEIIYRLERTRAEDKARKQQAYEDAKTLSKGSMSDRLDRIERALEYYERLLKAQQKVSQDALDALAKALATTSLDELRKQVNLIQYRVDYIVARVTSTEPPEDGEKK